MTGRIGSKVGNYRLISRLGHGGFAEVYLGEHIYLRSKAAIKLLNTQLSEQNKKQFLEEARYLVNLTHPHIVRVLDFGVEEEIPFLVMDFASQGSLRKLHPSGMPLPLATIVNYTKQIADGLQYAHDQRLIHRDIKPENMLVGRNNEILLSDFGIAILAQSTLTQTVKEVAGTAAYMAPEQFLGKPRPASDQYALGIVIYEWLCGECPFKGTFTEIASQHLYLPPPPLRDKNPTITPDIEQVVQTALAKDPKQRFTNVRAFANALEQASQATQSPLFFASSNEIPYRATQIDSASPPIETIDADKPSHTGLNTPSYLPSPSQQPATAQTSNEAFTLPQQITPASPIAIPAQPTPSPSRIPRRTALAGLAAIGTIVAIGGGVAIWEHVSSLSNVLGSTNPHSTASSTGAMFGLNPQHTHFNIDEHILSTGSVSRLVQAWAAPVEGAIGLSSPAVANGMVYIGSFDHKVYAFDAATGRRVWATSTQDTIYSSPAVAKNVVYIGSADNNVYALDALSGHVIWTFTTGGVVGSSPAVVNGVVYIGSSDHKMYALDASSGHVIWTFTTGSNINSSPAIVDNVVYFGSYDHKMYAVDAGGKLIWATPVAGTIFDSPAVDSGIVYIGTKENSTLYAINVSTGKIDWMMQTGDYINSSPAIAYGTVYVGAKDGKLYAFDAFSGTKKWTAVNIQSAEVASSPTVANGVVYAGSWNRHLYAIDAYNGNILWYTVTGDAIESSPTVLNGVVYVGSRDHNLYAFKLPHS